jgi:hypothetical protein
MIKSVKNIKYSNAMVIATLLSSIAVFNAHAVSVESDPSQTIDMLNQSLDSSYIGVDIPNVDLSGIPLGNNSSFQYSTDGDGISVNANGSLRYKKDFGKYVNTSSENVTLLNVTAGFGGGISLGCNGLDMGLEALFEFDAGDILKYLPKYILTNLATEALAQIYATPLISAVMDGLKSMQNFTAEMKQASCNMSDVMTRASEIRKARVQDCLDGLTEDGRATKAALAECEDSSELVKKIKEKQESISNRESAGTSISKLLNDNGVPYGDGARRADGSIDVNADGYIGSGVTTSSLMKMFIPDIKFSANGGGTETKMADFNTGSAYDQAFNKAYNTIYGIYEDIKETIVSSNLPNSKINNDIIDYTQMYKEITMKYGSQEVFTDTSPKNKKEYDSAEKIETIKKQFESYYRVGYKNPKVTSGYDEFIIGPKNGPNGYMTNKQSNFKGDALNIMLDAGESCFTKVYSNPEDTDGDYKWYALHNSPEVLVNSLTSKDADKINDALINKLATCKALDRFNIYLTQKISEESNALGRIYMKKLAANTAIETTQSIVNILSAKTNELIGTESEKLKSKCEAKGPAAMPNEAYYDGQANQAFKSCDDYVKQNKMSPEKVKYLQDKQVELEQSISVLKNKVKTIDEEFGVMINIAISKSE